MSPSYSGGVRRWSDPGAAGMGRPPGPPRGTPEVLAVLGEMGKGLEW